MTLYQKYLWVIWIMWLFGGQKNHVIKLKVKNCVNYKWIAKKNLCASYTEAAPSEHIFPIIAIFFLFCNHGKLLIVSTYYPIEVISFKDRDGVIEFYPIGSLSWSVIAYLNALYTIRKCMLIRQILCKCVYKVLCLDELTFKIDKDKNLRNKSCLNPFSASLNE